MNTPNVAQWGRFEHCFSSTALYINPFQDVELVVKFTAPSGRERIVDAFWNGGTDWRVRFMPDEIGAWTFSTLCSDSSNAGLHAQTGKFTCSEPNGTNRFEKHGPIQLSADRFHFVHADGTPFFWLADTAWNGPLRSTPDEWNTYLDERTRQKFTGVQWVATQWISAPDGDWTGELPYSGCESIALHPSFFQRLDQKIIAMNRAGLLSIPVLLWAASWSSYDVNARNPGFLLPEDQAIKLARYMVSRWGAYFTLWILNGDGDYRGEKSELWKRIGRAVFNTPDHAPVSLHVGGMHWISDEFRTESWMDVIGYQSGHGDDENTFDWIVCGPPATDWATEPARPFINLEAPYENHIAYQSRKPHDAHSVRRATYWSLLVSPTAGVSYGGHGIWGWDDGTAPPVGHPNTGVPLNWRAALLMPAAEQMRYISELFESVAWWKLRPAQDILAVQPGENGRYRYITAARSDEVTLIYLPQNEEVVVHADAFPPDVSSVWFDPRSGQRQGAQLKHEGTSYRFIPPSPGDWVLLLGNPIAISVR